MTEVGTHRVTRLRGLERQILTAFKRALADDRLDVAEYLLQALETFQYAPESGTSLASAYEALSDSARTMPRKH